MKNKKILTPQEKKDLYKMMTRAPRVVGYVFSGIGVALFLLFGSFSYLTLKKTMTRQY